MRTTYLLPMLIVASALSGCAAPVLMGAAAAGAVVVNQDERDTQTFATDEKIELNAAEIASGAMRNWRRRPTSTSPASTAWC